MAITVCALARAPVKGMRLMACPALEVGPTGAAGDRAFVVLEADHRLVSTERNPRLLRVAPSFEPGGELTLRFPGSQAVSAVPRLGAPVSCEFYDHRTVAGRLVQSGPLCAALSAHLRRPVRLMAVDGGQTAADDFPLTLMSQASLAAVGADLDGGRPDPRRFRMNVTLSGLGAWEEHGWAGREIALGGQVRLRIVDPVPRCVVTTHHPDSGDRDVPVLHALARLRGKADVTFGVWCQVTGTGVVRVGDTAALL